MTNRLGKFASGRMILTLAAAYVFVWAAVHNLIDGEQIMAIIMLVFSLYFGKARENGKP